MAKISVIIPVFNDEKYIGRCLDSFLQQTMTDIEIIVVDDGSTDNTPNILKKYIDNDSRIKVIRQENQKQGAARNNGLKSVTSEYITFADSDDWVDSDFCELLYNSSIKYNADISVSSAIRIKENGKYRTYYDYKDEKLYTDFQEFLHILNIPHYWQVWGKLYKKSLLDGLFFEEGVFYEDPEYLIKVLHKCKSLCTVKNTKYYYFSNPNSTIKAKHNIAKRQDSVNSMEKVYAYVKKYALKFPTFQIGKDSRLLSCIKTFTDRKEFYLLGFKYLTKKQEYDLNKTILVFNTACFGDVLLCNPLCQNLKNIYPDAKVVFIVNKPFYDVAKYQLAVDDVVVYDKKGIHKGIFGLFKFVKEFKYKNILASFITYKNERNLFIAKLLKSKYIIKPPRTKNEIPMQQKHCNLLNDFTNKKIINYPMRYQTMDSNFEELKTRLNLPEEYIALCAISKNPPKDMPIRTAIDVIAQINNKTNYKVVLVGTGKKTEQYAKELGYMGLKYINAVGKTTIPELATILQHSKCLISVDTGTMHLGCALQTPTVCVFYEQLTIKPWSPSSDLYNSVLIKENQTAENILNAVSNIVGAEQ